MTSRCAVAIAGHAVLLLLLVGCTPAPSPEASLGAPETAEVIAVVDGDTIDVSTSDGDARVRLIGIDTPEIGRDGAVGDCYAPEARQVLDELLYGRTVQLRADPTQADTDRYGRLLRHVFVDDESASVTVLQAGAGYEHTFDRAYIGQEAHRAAEAAASAADAGLWAVCR